MKIALWGNFGTLNLGNECTLAAMVGNLRKRLPDAQLMCICCGPDDTASRHAIAAISISGQQGLPDSGARLPKPIRVLRRIAMEGADWLRALRHASTVDALLITGTGIITDAGEGSLGLPYQLFKWCLVTRLCGGRIFFVSVGTESVTGSIARKFLRAALGLAHYRCYRDRHSMILTQSLGVTAARDAICPDLAFSLPQRTAAAAPRGRSGRPAVAVGLFNYLGRGLASKEDAAAYADYIRKMCSLIEWLLDQQYPVRVVIGDRAYDDSVLDDVRAELATRGRDLAIPGFADEPAASFEDLLGQLATVDFVIASRFHNVLLGLFLGKPVISVSYEAKNEALMQDMGLQQYCQTLGALNLSRLIEQFLELEHNAESLRRAVIARSSANRGLLEKQYDLIAASAAGADTPRP